MSQQVVYQHFAFPCVINTGQNPTQIEEDRGLKWLNDYCWKHFAALLLRLQDHTQHFYLKIRISSPMSQVQGRC